MIRKILMLLVVAIFMGPLVVAQAQDCPLNPYGLEWDENTETDLWGYRVYKAPTSNGQVKGEGNYVISIPKGDPSYVFPTDHPDGTFFWKVTAIDEAKNESGWSNEIETEFDHTAPAPPAISCMSAPPAEPPTP